MARLPKDWERRLVELAAVHGVTDFLLRGRLTKAESKVFYSILNKIGKPAARRTAVTAGRLGATAFQVGKTIALRHPVLTAGAVIYYTYKNREEIGDLVEQGYEVVKESGALSPTRIMQAREEFIESRPEEFQTLPFTDIKVQKRPGDITRLFPVVKRKRSNYNKAVSAGMKAIKASTSFGKKGVIKPAKRAFSTVISVGKGLKAKRKAPKKGIRRKVYTAMKRFYK